VLLGRPLAAGVAAHEGVHAHACGSLVVCARLGRASTAPSLIPAPPPPPSRPEAAVALMATRRRGGGGEDENVPTRSLGAGKKERKKAARACGRTWGGWAVDTCARAGADARVWPDAIAYILCECDLSHWTGDGRIKNVRPFVLNGPFSFLWLVEPLLQILHLFFF
jgi:hypothetical protein